MENVKKIENYSDVGDIFMDIDSVIERDKMLLEIVKTDMPTFVNTYTFTIVDNVSIIEPIQ